MVSYDKILFRVEFYSQDLPAYLVDLNEATCVLQRWNNANGTNGYVNKHEEVFYSWTYGEKVLKDGSWKVAVQDSLEPFFRAFMEEKKFKKKIESNIKELLCSED